MRQQYRFIVLLISFCLSFFCPAAAADVVMDYQQKSDFWTWIAGTNSLLHDFIGYTTGAVCSKSEDGYHHASSYIKSHDDGLYTCICDECGERFVGYLSDAQQSYEDQVASLPATSVGSDGYLYWMPEFDHGEYVAKYSSSNYDTFYFGNTIETPHLSEHGTVEQEFNPFIFSRVFDTLCYEYVGYPTIYLIGSAPVDGYYISPTYRYSGYYIISGQRFELSAREYDYSSTGPFYSAGSSVSFSVLPFILPDYISKPDYVFIQFDVYPVKIQPLSGLIDPVSDTTYNINSRPTSITGDYGIIGDNGQITKVDNTTIVNETNNVYTNPSTGTTCTITEWNYDYSNRSYDLTLDNGDTVMVTYGDENVTIQEGDTVYNVYYIVEGTPEGGGETPGTDTCQHSYTSTVDREATCTVPGEMTYTCSLCGHTYTEAIPAKGHTWTVLQTVTTEYDQEGNLLQQGYTLYQCSVCGEQYKDENGTGPPNSDGDGGGESIWDKLGNFLGSIFGGVIGLIEAVLGAILDALTALAAMIGEKLAAVVSLVLKMFAEIPALFTGFLGFLTAVFPFLPEDVMLLLTFGIAVVVFIGIIKALRR